VPTPTAKVMAEGELDHVQRRAAVPRLYNSSVGDTGRRRGQALRRPSSVCSATWPGRLRSPVGQLVPGRTGKEMGTRRSVSIDSARVMLPTCSCPTSHTIGLYEAEGPFLRPPQQRRAAAEYEPSASTSALFGMPDLHGARYRTGLCHPGRLPRVVRSRHRRG